MAKTDLTIAGELPYSYLPAAFFNSFECHLNTRVNLGVGQSLNVTGPGRNLRANRPPWSFGLQSVTRTPIVLNVDHGHERSPGSLDESGDAQDCFVESLVDFLLARQIGNGQDTALDVDDEKCGLGGRHTFSLTGCGRAKSAWTSASVAVLSLQIEFFGSLLATIRPVSAGSGVVSVTGTYRLASR